MSIIENKTGLSQKNIFMLAKRDNNTKRTYLLVNTLQGKHLPVAPHDALSLFEKLGTLLKTICDEEKVLVIGFAETATAIGATVASCIPESFYIQTTREPSPHEYKIVDFNEEHSHAVEQNLYCANWTSVIKNIDRIIFVEDEITTGNTILNFVQALQEKKLIKPTMKISVASLINGMGQSHFDQFHNQGIDLYYLIKIDNSDYAKEIFKYENSFIADESIEVQALEIITQEFSGVINPRIGTNIIDYQQACQSLARQIISAVNNDLPVAKKVLLLGTEECMYPALIVANTINEQFTNLAVKFHATTRSPILPALETDYPIHARYRLRSFYDHERATYIYNLETYDLVIIVTDASQNIALGTEDLVHCLSSVDNKKIFVAKWVS